MCKFLSGITLENGDVKISPNTDSHSEILKEFGIKDKEIPPSFVAWEYTPPIESDLFNFNAPYDKWTFNVDEHFPKPDWWDKGREALTVEAARRELDRVIIKTHVDEIKTGRWIIANGGDVNSISGGTVKYISGGTVKYISGGTVNFIRGGTVEYISGGTVEYISGGTVEYISGGTVNDIRGGTVNYISGGTVNDIRGGTVNSIRGGTVNDISGGTVNDIRGGTVNYISGGTVEYISGGTVKYISGGTVNDISGGTVNSISGGTVKTLKGAATITIYTDYTKYRITPTENAVVIHRSENGVKIITAKKAKKSKK